LSGKKATFRIVVKKIQEAKRPKTQEDLMKKFGYKEKDAFLDEIKKVVEQSCNAKIKADIRSQIEDQLQDYEFMVPSSLLERQKQIIKKANQNKDEINTEDEALKTARLSLIFARFATLKNLKLDKQDVIEHLKKTSSIIGVPENYLFQTYQNSKDFAGSLNVRLMEEKIVSALCNTVKNKISHLLLQKF
jgi:trigger factor